MKKINDQINADYLSKANNFIDKNSKEMYLKKISDILMYNHVVPVNMEYLKMKEISQLNDFIDSPSSKTIYALHLIDGDNTRDAPGVDCESTV